MAGKTNTIVRICREWRYPKFREISRTFLFTEDNCRIKHNCKISPPCLKEIPLQGEMSRSDKRVAVPARKVGFIRKNKTRRDISGNYFKVMSKNN